METKTFALVFTIWALMILSNIFNTHDHRRIQQSINDLKAKIQPQTFFDGEGNTLPNKAVELLVLSQYANITPAEADTLNKYFYSTKH